tara:strand:+ start:305 stop:1045 length:741 start_codon:yes stop_codon:yes gene_type:complete
MKILIVGCSVVRGAYMETPSWAEMVKQETQHEVDMIQSNGMGNEYISHVILQNMKNYDAFITVWSPADGRDICYSDRKKVKLFSSSGCTSKENDNLWVHAGGFNGSWHVEQTEPVFRPYFKNQFDVIDSWYNMLSRILLVNEMLKNKHQLNLFYSDTLEKTPDGVYDKNLPKDYNRERWEKFKETCSYVEHIDWDTFWFHKNAHSNTGGLVQYCHDNSDTTGTHPSPEGHKIIFENIIRPWLNNNE